MGFFFFLIWLHWVLVVTHRIFPASCRIFRCSGWAPEHVGLVSAAYRPSCFLACGILVPWPGIEPVFPALQGRFLTTGPPRKSWDGVVLKVEFLNSSFRYYGAPTMCWTLSFHFSHSLIQLVNHKTHLPSSYSIPHTLSGLQIQKLLRVWVCFPGTPIPLSKDSVILS